MFGGNMFGGQDYAEHYMQPDFGSTLSDEEIFVPKINTSKRREKLSMALKTQYKQFIQV